MHAHSPLILEVNFSSNPTTVHILRKMVSFNRVYLLKSDMNTGDHGLSQFIYVPEGSKVTEFRNKRTFRMAPDGDGGEGVH